MTVAPFEITESKIRMTSTMLNATFRSTRVRVGLIIAHAGQVCRVVEGAWINNSPDPLLTCDCTALVSESDA